MKSKVKHLIVVFITIGIVAAIAISCDKEDEVNVPDQVPTLTTSAVFNIANNSATSGGNISDNYDSPVTARGVCWSTEPNPNVSDSKTVDGLGIGPFESNITGLASGQVYYVRAYATNASGNGYGSTLQFTTLGNQGQVPVLTTTAVTSITTSSAISGGNISSDNGSSVTERGVCWSTNPTPTINDNKTTDGSGIGSFQSNIIGLSPDQTYYIRAYATNAAGTGYGSALQFLTLGGGGSTVTDPDGNTYNTLTIGTQVWLKENLKTTKYNDGSPIPHITDGVEWSNMTTPAYCWYDNDYDEFGLIYGGLYNWYTVNPANNGNKNICPAGWHVPSKDEWEILINHLGGRELAGGKLKESGTAHWTSPNVGATNESGFTALAGGDRLNTYTWNIKNYAWFWTTTESTLATNAWKINLHYSNIQIPNNSGPKRAGYSVRCIKD